MSLYNQLFGVNRTAGAILLLLDAHSLGGGETFRFRDAYYDGEHLVILTRTGGGNRFKYAEQNAKLRTLAGFVRDADDDYDNTYAYFYYKLPGQYASLEPELAKWTPKPFRERWEAVIDKMKTGGINDPNDPQMAAARKIEEQLAEAVKDGSGVKIIET